jgi:hypothetical protein
MLYSSPNIWVIKSRRISREGHVARMETAGCIQDLWGKLMERDHLKDPGVDKMILRRIFRKWDVGAQTRSIWLRVGTGGGHL